MDKLHLSWTCSPKGGSKKSDSWDDIGNQLNNLRLSSGCVTVNKLDDEGCLISGVQARMEKGVYLVTFLNEDDEVMTLSDLTQPNEMILVLGDYWSARQVTKDFDLVVRIFKEFFDTGNVSGDLLN
ncbi:hypothetical protein FCH33_18800 [Serratia fonticola]|uniref:DUF6911 family protein n=1 Tax=Serratia fonticola TaxID=47917 RepID=UPI0015762F6E|nr:hypothetical protein [Serratia fonticola]NTY88826.1 hypothetical protein [Serratia fonticola]NTZ14388.1 hypothetical protein [Serratia fonticola]